MEARVRVRRAVDRQVHAQGLGVGGLLPPAHPVTPVTHEQRQLLAFLLDRIGPWGFGQWAGQRGFGRGLVCGDRFASRFGRRAGGDGRLGG